MNEMGYIVGKKDHLDKFNFWKCLPPDKTEQTPEYILDK